MEEYIPLKSFDNQIGISKEAKIVNFKTGHLLSPYTGIDNYQHVVITFQGKRYRKRVHRLMAEAFLNNCEVVDHLDGNKSNNQLSNLRATTHSENIKKAYQENTYKNPHKGRGIWVVAKDKETNRECHFKSMRECETFTGVDRHRIKTFLENSRSNYTKYEFFYDK